MKIKFHYWICIFFILKSSTSFSQERFYKNLYDTDSIYSYAVFDLAEKDSSYFVSLGCSDNTWRLLNFNKNGEIVKTISTFLPLGDYDPQFLIEGKTIYSIGGTKRAIGREVDYYFLKMDTNGIVESFKTYGDSLDDVLYRMVRLGDYIYAAGYKIALRTKDTTKTKSLIVKFNLQGDTIWSKRLNFSSGMDIALDKQNNLLITSMSWRQSSLFKDDQLTIGKAFLLDTNGNQIWESKLIDSNGYELQTHLKTGEPSKEGGYILAGNVEYDGYGLSDVLFRLDSLGNVLQLKRFQIKNFDSSNFVSSIMEFVELEDKSIVCTGLSGERFPDSANTNPGYFGRTFSTVTKYDKNFKLIWKRKYLGPAKTDKDGFSFARRIIQCADSGFLFGGHNAFNKYQQICAFVVKVDSFGCLEPGCQLLDTVDTIKNPDFIQVILPKGEYIDAFPNPANAQITILCAINNATSGELIIEDISGKQIYKKKVNIFENVIDINTSKYPPGIYFYRLLMNGKNVSAKKFIVFH